MPIVTLHPLLRYAGPPENLWCGTCGFMEKHPGPKFKDPLCLNYYEILEFQATEAGQSLECVRCPSCLKEYPIRRT